jgi:viroplasmin and RNaseH domain-containing protein
VKGKIKMYTRKVFVMYRGVKICVEVACNPNDSEELLKTYAIKKLKREEEKKRKIKSDRFLKQLGIIS